MNDLIPFSTATQMVAQYEESIKEVKQAFLLINAAKKRTESIYEYSHTFIHSTMGNEEIILIGLKMDIWNGVLQKLNIKSFLTAKRALELERSLKDPANLPEITVENLMAFAEKTYSEAPEMITEFVKETFDWLQPDSRDDYKTNQKSKYEIKEKIIQDRVFDNILSYGLYSSREKNLQSLDNTFSLLDGKGVSKYPTDSITVLKSAIKQGKWEAETEYFKYKFYKNGNLHIEFKRLDLVQKVNHIANEFNLKETVQC